MGHFKLSHDEGTIHPKQKSPLTIFRDWRAASRHICDHLLTSPESCYWKLIFDAAFPSYSLDIDLDDGWERYRHAKKMWESKGLSGQSTYHKYACMTQDSLSQVLI